MALRIGVDSGGTFTDVCLFEESTGHIAVWKVSSTPTDPSRAVADGVGEALAQVQLPDGPVTHATIDELGDGFAAAHQRLYGFVAEDEPMQLVTFRAEVTGIVRKAELQPTAEAGPDPHHAQCGRRDVWLREAGAFVSCPLYDRERLFAGNHVEGPAIVEQMDATTLIVPGATPPSTHTSICCWSCHELSSGRWPDQPH
jgi:N-methylhydantoinase A/oxoprolinase/acetone carboxylase beta subunit